MRKGGLRRGFSEDVEDMEDSVIPDVMNDIFYPKEDTLKIFVDISIRSVSRKGGTWRTLRVPDPRHEEHGQS